MQKVTDEIIRFMRGRYALDEVPGKHYEADCLRFRQGKKAIVTVILAKVATGAICASTIPELRSAKSSGKNWRKG